MGTCGYHYLRKTDDVFTAEVGFDLSKRYWGKGLMFEAMKVVIDFGFSKMGLTIVDATVEPENERSIRLLRKLGFEREIELRDHLIYFYLNRNRFEDNSEDFFVLKTTLSDNISKSKKRGSSPLFTISANAHSELHTSCVE
ncbi:GNAT family N-acetyltransferase [Paenibacillus sp. FJAT-27812]|uniref:GNAT family N-acetyltransferase n=1 Tax=Paenibacillus sp. FJAT-27812 TaxID=1684143 RepID=UPI002F4148E1